ncbi:hypothetical protein [Bacillus seohaeanensis]|uniref:Uncharacterized protein n=1 Tax=Bacillus seohaeanensis TaxID=284580 RepID=A0ABW5RTX9_9BACI
MEFTVTGHELNTIHDMKKLSIVVTQAVLDELQEATKHKRKIRIVTSNSFIVADKISTQEPDKDNMPLLDRALLESEETTFRIMENGNIVNVYAMIILHNVKIVPFANPDKPIESESFAIFTDHIMGITLTD